MSSRMEQELVELKNRVLELEKSIVGLAKWTNFKNFNQVENNEPEHVANKNSVGETAGNVDSNGNPEGDLEEIDIVCKVEGMDGNEGLHLQGISEAVNPSPSELQGENDTVIGVTVQRSTTEEGTISKIKMEDEKEFSAGINPEPVPSISIDRQNEDGMPSTEVRGSCVVEQGSNDKGVVPLPIKIEKDVVFLCKVENEKDFSDEDINSSIPSCGSDSARTVEKTSQKKKSTAKKSPSAELKSAFVSLKRLSSAQILSAKNKISVKSKPQWKCPHCPKTLSCKSLLEMHIRRHTGERPFPCPHCPFATTHPGNLRSHIRKIHPKENQNLFSCKICPSKFPSQKNLTTHMKSHLKCYFCSQGFRKYCKIQLHLATHTREKPFSCPHCRYATCDEGNLKRHAEIHKQFINNCDICNMIKPKKSHRIHMKTHKNYKFKCYFCSEMFRWRSSLRKHLGIHTGERPNSTPSN